MFTIFVIQYVIALKFNVVVSVLDWIDGVM